VLNVTRPAAAWPETQTEYEFWRSLAVRLGAGEYFPWRDETELDRWLLEPSGITLEELEAHPEGVSYVARQERAAGRSAYPTQSGKVELTSRHLAELGYDELPVYRRPAYREHPDPAYPFVLMTGARALLYGHSRSHNIPRFLTADPRAVVELHPDDATRLGVNDGEVVRVTSRIGNVEVAARVVARNEILPGCLQMTHGWSGGNANLLTHDDRFDPVSGFPLMKSVEVRVETVGSR